MLSEREQELHQNWREEAAQALINEAQERAQFRATVLASIMHTGETPDHLCESIRLSQERDHHSVALAELMGVTTKDHMTEEIRKAFWHHLAYAQKELGVDEDALKPELRDFIVKRILRREVHV